MQGGKTYTNYYLLQSVLHRLTGYFEELEKVGTQREGTDSFGPSHLLTW